MSKGIFATIFDLKASYILATELNFDALVHLSSIGLIELQFTREVFLENLGPEFSVSYCGKLHKLKAAAGQKEVVLPIGHVLLTMAGKELARITIRQRNDEFEKGVLFKWSRCNWLVE